MMQEVRYFNICLSPHDYWAVLNLRPGAAFIFKFMLKKENEHWDSFFRIIFLFHSGHCVYRKYNSAARNAS